MKKLLALALAVVCLLSLTGCSGRTEAEAAEYKMEEAGQWYLILPASREKISVSEDYEQYLDRIDPELLKMAEETISGQILPGTDGSGFYLEAHGEQLYLCMELIVYIDPPATVTLEDGTVLGSGCGIDHEHLFFSEGITKNP